MGLNAELIRLFYELWEASLPGREYILGADLPDSFERLPRSNAADVMRTLRHMNRLGHLLTLGPLPAEFVTSLIGKEVIRTVAKVSALLANERARRNDPEYLQFIDELLAASKAAYPDYEPYYPIERHSLGLGV